MRQPNPLDPLDDFKRWMSDLWPAERAMVWVTILLLIAGAVAWAVR